MMKPIFGVNVSIACALLFAPLTKGAEAPLYQERFRPQFHFSPAKNWMNDPNGMVFYDGEYHLFYQYNPFGDKWGHMSWGHAVSPDLLHWEHLPVALQEENGVMIFSGSAVVDWRNSSGFGKEGKPPLVAIYTGHYTTKPLQNQHIAFSNDRGRTWTKFAGNPVLDIWAKDFRDPKVMWHEESQGWIMTVAMPTERKVRFYRSLNLREWTYLSEFGPAGAPAGIWECPDLFPLRIEGSDKTAWFLMVNIGSGSVAGGSGAQYFVGQFDGERFVAEQAQAAAPVLWVDYGKDFYAAVSWSDIPKSDGRRIWLGWMSNWEYAGDVPTSPWRSAMSIPRELSLRRTEKGLRLAQTPAREIEQLRGVGQRFSGGSIAEANAWIHENRLTTPQSEWIIHLEPANSQPSGLRLFKGEQEEAVVKIDRSASTLSFDRAQFAKSRFHPKFPGIHTAPLRNSKDVRLRIFADTSSVEIFADGGETVITDLVLPGEKSAGVEFFGPQETRILSVERWPLKSVWPPAISGAP